MNTKFNFVTTDAQDSHKDMTRETTENDRNMEKLLDSLNADYEADHEIFVVGALFEINTPQFAHVSLAHMRGGYSVDDMDARFHILHNLDFNQIAQLIEGTLPIPEK